MWLCVGIEITPAKEIPNESAMVAAAKLNSLNSASIYNQTRNKSINQNSTFCIKYMYLLLGTSSFVTRFFWNWFMQLSQPCLGQSECTRYMFMCWKHSDYSSLHVSFKLHAYLIHIYYMYMYWVDSYMLIHIYRVSWHGICDQLDKAFSILYSK